MEVLTSKWLQLSPISIRLRNLPAQYSIYYWEHLRKAQDSTSRAKISGTKANNQPSLISESATPTPANCTSSTDACYRRHEREKRRAYKQCVLEVEHGTFTPLVLSTSGGWGPSAMVAFKRLAGLISEKHDQPYSSTLSFIKCKIAFSLINSANTCLQGPRSAFHARTST